MRTRCYLVLGPKGVRHMRKSRPALEWDEVAVQIVLEVSDDFFHRSIPEAHILIPDEAIIKPQISVEVELDETLFDDERRD